MTSTSSYNSSNIYNLFIKVQIRNDWALITGCTKYNTVARLEAELMEIVYEYFINRY